MEMTHKKYRLPKKRFSDVSSDFALRLPSRSIIQTRDERMPNRLASLEFLKVFVQVVIAIARSINIVMQGPLNAEWEPA